VFVKYGQGSTSDAGPLDAGPSDAGTPDASAGPSTLAAPLGAGPSAPAIRSTGKDTSKTNNTSRNKYTSKTKRKENVFCIQEATKG
jgi:hypothetical protein